MSKVTNAALMALVMVLSTLIGCLDGGTSIEDEIDELGLESLPKQSIGVSMPIIDGILTKPLMGVGIGFDEWADSFTFPSGDYSFTGSHNGKVDESSIGFHMKAVGDDVAVALEVPLITGTNASVVSVSSEFYYFDGVEPIPSISQRSASVGEAGSPWQVEMMTPCEFVDCIEEEFSIIQKSDFEAMPSFISGEEEESTVDYTGLFDLFPAVIVDFEHLLAAKQSTTLLTIETLKYGALEHSRSLSAVFITITFEDGDEIEVWKWEDMYFGYANPSSKETDVGITGIELIQVVQTEDMEMPLVKQMPTLARVYVTSDIDMFDVEVNFQICFLLLCTSPITKELSAPNTVDRADFGKSANFVIPQDWLEFDSVSVVANVNIPYVSEFSDTDSSNDMWAETFQLTTTSEVTSAFVRVSQNTDSDSALEQLNYARATKVMGLNMDLMPLNDYTIQEFSWEYESGATYDATGCENDECRDEFAAAVEDYRTQLVAAWIDSGCLSSGSDCPLPPIPFQWGGIYPGGGTTGGIADPVWGGGDSFAYMAAASFADQDGTHIPIHEIQHNIGPHNDDDIWNWDDYGPGEWGEHLSTTGVGDTDDCGASGQDSVWTSIYGSSGKPFDIKDLGWNHNNVDPETNQDALVPSSYPDLMTYCIALAPGETWESGGTGDGGYDVPYLTDDYRAWMSTYRWLRNHDYFSNHDIWDPSGGTYARSASNMDSNIIRTVSLSLSMDENSNYVVEDFNSDITTGIMSAAYGTDEVDEKGFMSIIALDENGNILATRPVNPVFVGDEINDHGASTGSPEVDETELSTHRVRFEDKGDIETVVLIDSDGKEIDYLASTVDVRSNGEVYEVYMDSRSYARDGAMQIGWDKVDTLGFKYSVEYSTGDGIWYPLTGWLDANSGTYPISKLPASDEALVRVQANNGFDSAFMYSTPFKVENQAPILDVDIQAGPLMINSAMPQPDLIPFGGKFSEKEAQEIMSAAMRMPNIAISQFDTITITPNVQDFDWEVVNDKGCEISLERDGRIIWSWQGDIHGQTHNSGIMTPDEGTKGYDPAASGSGIADIIRSTYTVDNIFANSKNDPCTSKGGKFSSVTFPNPDFPPHMMMPGGYSLKITYEDAQGAEATPVVVNFNVIEHRPYTESDLKEFQEKLVVVHPQYEGGDIERLCQLWSTADWARDAEKTEGISPEDYKAIAETDMATICALEGEATNLLETDTAGHL